MVAGGLSDEGASMSTVIAKAKTRANAHMKVERAIRILGECARACVLGSLESDDPFIVRAAVRAMREGKPKPAVKDIKPVEEDDVHAKSCQSCHGFGYRVLFENGLSINAESAKMNGVKGQKVFCESCAMRAAA
jgi:hypothetical protein